jgi:hypothetical protein
MEIILLDKTNQGLWDDFCLSSDDAWFWHTTGWMDYVVNYKPEYKPKQLSFLVKEDNKYIAICPVLLEDHDGVKEFSFSGFAMPAPAFLNGLPYRVRKKVQDFVFEYIDSQAKLFEVRKAAFRFSPLAPGSIRAKFPPSNYLLKYGYLDATFNTQIIDLLQPIEELKNNVRNGHTANISKMARVLDIEVFDSGSITRASFDLYCQLHHKDAGRITRPQVTFDLMFDWIKQDKAVLLGAKLKDKDQFVGFAYFMKYKAGAYYGSACSDPDFGQLYIAHFLLWEAVKWLKSKDIKFFELGWQFYGPAFHQDPSEKECAISKFKRGFGGEQVSQIVAEKYYDLEIFQNQYSSRIESYKKIFNNTQAPGVKG